MKSLIYLNGTNTTPYPNGVIGVPTIKRRLGKCVQSNGVGATVQTGYYYVSVNATFTDSVAEDVKFTLLQDTQEIGLTATTTTTTTGVSSVSFSGIVRVYCNQTSTLTLTVDKDTVTVSNVNINVISE